MRRIIFLSLIVFSFVVVASAAEWVGFWGGGVPNLEEQFPGIGDVEAGRWTDLPICWGFDDSGVKAWTISEREVSRAVITLWNDVDLFGDESNPTEGQIFEDTALECNGRDVDIVLRWEDSTTVFQELGDLDGDGIATNFTEATGDYIPIRTTPQFQFEPCNDMVESGFLERCSVIIVNANQLDQFFIDPTPGSNEEFSESVEQICGEENTLLRITAGGPADGLTDFYSVIGHFFGHSLGLLNSFGCDGTPFTQSAEDDDGSIMYAGFPDGRRNP
jgi:hypothetical protein